MIRGQHRAALQILPRDDGAVTGEAALLQPPEWKHGVAEKIVRRNQKHPVEATGRSLDALRAHELRRHPGLLVNPGVVVKDFDLRDLGGVDGCPSVVENSPVESKDVLNPEIAQQVGRLLLGVPLEKLVEMLGGDFIIRPASVNLVRHGVAEERLRDEGRHRHDVRRGHRQDEPAGVPAFEIFQIGARDRRIAHEDVMRGVKLVDPIGQRLNPQVDVIFRQLGDLFLKILVLFKTTS